VWCRARNITWVSRRADLQRHSATHDRDVYEKRTREFRFQLYREALALSGATGVMLVCCLC